MDIPDAPSRIWLGAAIAAALRDYRWPDQMPDPATGETPMPSNLRAGVVAEQRRAASDPRLAELIHRRETLRETWEQIAAALGYSSGATALRTYRRHQRRTREVSHAAD